LSRKPAMYVDGNIHGNEIQGTEICLYLAWLLCNSYGTDRRITELVDTRTFYIVPSVNVDGRISFFRDPHNPHSPRGSFHPRDDDQDGLVDEDGPDDVDGDGRLLSMRKRDPFGRLKTGADRRSMVPADFGERGEWSLVGWIEGVDADGDGEVAEDPVGGVDMNRNFPAGWKPEHEQRGAGPYPFSEPEIRAVGMFLFQNRNIAAVQSFHNSGNLLLHSPGSVTDKTLPARDREVFKAIAARGEKLLPGYKAIDAAIDLYPTNGNTLDWAYFGCGALGFTNEIWNLPGEFQGRGNGAFDEDGHAYLRFLDTIRRDSYVDWKPFRHPQFGDVELGGYDQFSLRVPPIEYLEDICQRNTQFVLFHAESTPLLRITGTRTERLSAGLWRVEAVVANTGAMDTMPEASRQTGAYRPVIARIEVPQGVRVIQGAEKAENGPVTDLLREARPGLRRRDDRKIDLGIVRGQSKKVVQWIVSVPDGPALSVTVRASGIKAGEDSREIKVGGPN